MRNKDWSSKLGRNPKDVLAVLCADLQPSFYVSIACFLIPNMDKMYWSICLLNPFARLSVNGVIKPKESTNPRGLTPLLLVMDSTSEERAFV